VKYANYMLNGLLVIFSVTAPIFAIILTGLSFYLKEWKYALLGVFIYILSCLTDFFVDRFLANQVSSILKKGSPK